MKNIYEMDNDLIWVEIDGAGIPIAKAHISEFIKMLESSFTSQLDVWRSDPYNCPDLVCVRSGQFQLDLSLKNVPDIVKGLREIVGKGLREWVDPTAAEN
jgi:hypothetical protein